MTHLVCAVEHLGVDDGFRQHWLDWELCHSTSQPCQLALVIQRSESIQHLERPDNSFCRWFVQEWEVQNIIDTERFEHQDDHSQIRPLNFGDRIFE